MSVTKTSHQSWLEAAASLGKLKLRIIQPDTQSLTCQIAISPAHLKSAKLMNFLQLVKSCCHTDLAAIDVEGMKHVAPVALHSLCTLLQDIGHCAGRNKRQNMGRSTLAVSRGTIMSDSSSDADSDHRVQVTCLAILLLTVA